MASVCSADGFAPGEHGAANARLIAAAPRMKETLEEVAAALMRLLERHGDFPDRDLAKLLAQVDKVISDTDGQ